MHSTFFFIVVFVVVILLFKTVFLYVALVDLKVTP